MDCSQGTFVRVWTKHNVLSVGPEKTAGRAKDSAEKIRNEAHSKTEGHKIFYQVPKRQDFSGKSEMCPKWSYVCYVFDPQEKWIPLSTDPRPGEFFASSDLVILEPTSNIFVSPNHHFSGLLLLVLGRGTHLLLYLLGAKFSDLTCHPASSPRAGPVFPTPPTCPKKKHRDPTSSSFSSEKECSPEQKKNEKKTENGLRPISHPTKSKTLSNKIAKSQSLESIPRADFGLGKNKPLVWLRVIW